LRVLVASSQEQVHAPCRKIKPCTASLVRALPEKVFTASPQDIRHALCGYWWLRLKNKFMRLAEKNSLAPLRLFGLCRKVFTASPQDIRHALCGQRNAHYTTFVISFAGK